MWLRSTNGDCFNLNLYRRIFLQRGQQGSFDNKLHLTLMGDGNTYTDIAVIDLRQVPEEEAARTMGEYLSAITQGLSTGLGYYSLPQVSENDNES